MAGIEVPLPPGSGAELLVSEEAAEVTQGPLAASEEEDLGTERKLSSIQELTQVTARSNKQAGKKLCFFLYFKNRNRNK